MKIRIISHGPIFDGAARMLCYELAKLHHLAECIPNRGDWQNPLPAASEADALNIFVGPLYHTASNDHACVWWNFDLYPLMLAPTLNQFETGYVWEYCEANRSAFHHPNQSVLRLGYSPCWLPVESFRLRDIPVLFTGAESPHRKRIVTDMRAKGIEVVWDMFWGEELWLMMSRARIVLNLHAYPEHAQFEALRCFPAVECGAFVLTERSSNEKEYAPSFAYRMQPQSWESIPDACRQILDNGWDREDAPQQMRWLESELPSFRGSLELVMQETIASFTRRGFFKENLP